MSVSMWESPLRRDGRTSSMSTGRSQDNGGEWDTRRWTLDWSAAAVLGGSSWRPASCRCPHSAHRPAALPTDHWQRALLTTASPSLDSLQQSSPSSSSSSAESSADSSPEKTPATPWTQRQVGYERVSSGWASFFVLNGYTYNIVDCSRFTSDFFHLFKNLLLLS